MTRETFGALVHTTHALQEISEYCIHELGAKYVLFGKFQTDSLKSGFGQYRQLAGGKYDVSLRQVYECEKKIRLLSVLKLKLTDVDIDLSDFSIKWEQYEETSSSNFLPIPIAITEEDISSASDTIPVIAYIGGHCCYSIKKKSKCEECKLRIVSSDRDDASFHYSLIKGISRENLLYPNADILHIGLMSYILIQKIACFDEFLWSNS